MSFSENRLLTYQVLSHIDGAGNQDNQTLYDVLQVLVDGKELQRYENNTKQEYSHYYAADLTGTTNKGNAADNAGRNCVTLVVQTGTCLVRTDTGGLNESGNTITYSLPGYVPEW